MKICMSSDSYWPRVNGATVSIDTFRGVLTAQGHEVHLLVPEYPGGTGVGPQDDDKIYRLPSNVLMFSREDRLITGFRGFSNGMKVLTWVKPQILHAQTEFSTFRLLLKYKKKYGTPLVMTSHTYWEQYVSNYIPWLPGLVGKLVAMVIMVNSFRHADLIITPSHHMKEVLEGYGLKPPIQVISTGIDPDKFQGFHRDRNLNPVIQQNPSWKDKKILLFAGRLSQEKNLDFLLGLLQKLIPGLPDVHMVIVGDGPYRHGFEHKIKQLGLTDRFHFAGYVQRLEMKDYYALADVFVFPSKTETQGLVTIESMMCGTPVVAIGEMGTLEVMNGDNGGYMVKDDPQEFFLRTQALLTDPQLWRSKSVEALEYSKKWTIGTQAEKLLDAYTKLIQESN